MKFCKTSMLLLSIFLTFIKNIYALELIDEEPKTLTCIYNCANHDIKSCDRVIVNYSTENNKLEIYDVYFEYWHPEKLAMERLWDTHAKKEVLKGSELDFSNGGEVRLNVSLGYEQGGVDRFSQLRKMEINTTYNERELVYATISFINFDINQSNGGEGKCFF